MEWRPDKGPKETGKEGDKREPRVREKKMMGRELKQREPKREERATAESPWLPDWKESGWRRSAGWSGSARPKEKERKEKRKRK